MDKRTDFRPAAPGPRSGHGYYAAEARRALGLSHEILALPGRVPAPVFHAGVGVVVVAGALLARPQRVGYAAGVALDLALAAVAALALAYHARLVETPATRPGPAAGILPGAALLSLGLVLGGTRDALIDAVAVAVGAAVIAGAPHLERLDVVDRQGPGLRLLRELAGFAIVLPVCVAGASGVLPWAARAAIVLSGSAAVVGDALRVDRHRRPAWLAGAGVAMSAVTVGACSIAAPRAGQAAGATALLLVWYGVRGLATQLHRGGLRAALPLIEHTAFVAVGGALLGLAR